LEITQLKTTYLIKKKQEDGSVCLSVGSAAEWLAVVEANKQLPAEQRRYFILDYIADGDDLDRMVIEAPAEDYRVWHNEHMAAQRNRALGKGYKFLSLDAVKASENGPVRLSDILPSSEQLEETASCQVLMEELREKLIKWRPWGNDLLDMYLDGQKRNCSAMLAEKYGVSQRMVRKYKCQFENFVKNFLAGVPF